VLRTLTVVFVLLLGFYAGAQLGKFAPIILQLQQERGYSLVYMGWLTSLIALFVAVIAMPAAMFIRKIGPKASLNLGALLLFSGAMLMVWDAGMAMALVARAIEAAGYILVVIAAPAVLNVIAPVRLKSPALALWGGFVAIGFSMANFQAGLMMELSGTSGYFLSMAAGMGVTSLLAALCMTGLEVREVRTDGSISLLQALRLPLSAYLLAVGFGCYVIGTISFFTFLPTFLEEADRPLLLSAAAILLFVPIGNIAAGLLVSGRWRSLSLQAVTVAFIISSVSGLVAFNSEQPSMLLGGAIVFAISGGVIASLIFASTPAMATMDAPGSLILGVISQTGGIGTVIGPPIAAATIEYSGWPALGILICCMSLGGALIVCFASRSFR